MVKYDLSNLRVLIIEQHLVMRLLYRSVLRAFNILHLYDTSDFDEARELFKYKNPDIVLLDWAVDFDGLSYLKELRGEDSLNRFVSVVVVTSYTEAEHVMTARDAGATAFLAKPVTAQLLYDRICTAIENRRAFVRSNDFFGPDRRRRDRKFEGPDRRKKAKKKGEAAEAGAAPAEAKT